MPSDNGTPKARANPSSMPVLAELPPTKPRPPKDCGPSVADLGKFLGVTNTGPKAPTPKRY